jgi:hypothetical protein
MDEAKLSRKACPVVEVQRRMVSFDVAEGPADVRWPMSLDHSGYCRKSSHRPFVDWAMSAGCRETSDVETECSNGVERPSVEQQTNASGAGKGQWGFAWRREVTLDSMPSACKWWDVESWDMGLMEAPVVVVVVPEKVAERTVAENGFDIGLVESEQKADFVAVENLR